MAKTSRRRARPVRHSGRRAGPQQSNPGRQSRPALNSASLETTDPRVDRLTKFFSQLHCPVRSLSADFVTAADENHIDWRLLPSISVIESGGGKAYRNNNIFGWNNGNMLFRSIRRSIHEIAYKLGRSPLYRHRDTVGKLKHLQRRFRLHAQNVLEVMNRISPTPDVGSTELAETASVEEFGFSYRRDSRYSWSMLVPESRLIRNANRSPSTHLHGRLNKITSSNTVCWPTRLPAM